MNCKVTTFLIICFIAAFSPQQKKGADSTIIRVVTPENKIILLHPDNTWEYESVETNADSFFANADTMGTPKVQFKNVIRATVIDYKDGDTFDVLIENPVAGLREKETVRLLGVDAPELAGDEFFATNAAIYTKQLLKGNSIYLVLGSRSRDSFCRLLAYVYLNDGTFLNADLLSKGYVRLFTKMECLLYDRFFAIQNDAMAKRLGLWGERDEKIAILYIYNHAREEHVVIANNLNKRIDLSGWFVKDSEDNILHIPEHAFIEQHGLMRIYTGENGIADPPQAYYTLTENIWGNDGDAAYLFDSRGNLIDTYEY